MVSDPLILLSEIKECLDLQLSGSSLMVVVSLELLVEERSYILIY